MCETVVHRRLLLLLLLTCTMFEISIGNMDIGKRRILNSDKETKAVEAVRWLLSSTMTNVAKVTKAT